MLRLRPLLHAPPVIAALQSKVAELEKTLESLRKESHSLEQDVMKRRKSQSTALPSSDALEALRREFRRQQSANATLLIDNNNLEDEISDLRRQVERK